MQGNDLSNQAPPTIYVHVDLFTKLEEETVEHTRWLGLGKQTTTTTVRSVDLEKVVRYDRLSRRVDGVTFTCVSTDGQPLDKIEEYLDARALFPFRYFQVYRTVRDLSKELAYLPNVLGVMDLPERTLTWGSKSMSPDAFNRLF